MPRRLVLLAALALASCGGEEAHVRVAVAANFTEPAREIAGLFGEATGLRAALSFGSTGQLYAQIVGDAPFDVFLAADTNAPARLVEMGLAEPSSRITYAVGRLVLYTRTLDLAEPERILREARFGRLAMANPETAPYGRAALQTMEALGLADSLGGRLALGNSIAQAFQFVETGNADLGFVALSQMRGAGGAFWLVPPTLHSPIRQDAVLLGRSAGSEAARAFMDFLREPGAVAVIEAYGYEILR